MEKEEFINWWRQVQPQLLKRLKYYTTPLAHDVADDLVQDVAYLAWKKRGEFKNIEHFRHWILQTARWRAIDAVRIDFRKAKLPNVEQLSNPQEEPLGAAAEILNAVRRLPRQQALIIEGILRGKSTSQLAEELNIREATVRSLTRFARLRLQSMLEEGDKS